MRLSTRRSPLVWTAWLAASVMLSLRLPAQGSASSSPLMNWAGAIRCELQSQAPGYAHQETQTWTLTGTPTVQGSVVVYPATWTVTGRGWHDRSRGTFRRVAQWTVDVPGAGSPSLAAIGFTRHAVGGGFDVARRNAQLTKGGGYTGPEQYINDGVTQAPTRLVATAYEWQFSKIESASMGAQLTGSSTTNVRAFVGPLQPPDAQTTATCAWALGRGSAPPLPPATMSPLTPPATIAQGGSPPASAPSAPVATAPAPSAPVATAPVAGAPAASAPAAGAPAAASPPSSGSLAGASAVSGGTSSGTTVNQLVLACSPATFPPYVANPGWIRFMLSPQPGIVGYRISRRDLGDLTPSPITASSYTQLAPLEYSTTYDYGVIGVRSDGSCTMSAKSITPPRPLTPLAARPVVSSGPTTKVTLSWVTRDDEPTHHLLLGAGLPPDGLEVPAPPNAAQSTPPAQSIDTGNLSPGTYGWLIIPVWKTPAGTMVDASTGARVTATVGSGSGTAVPQSMWDALAKMTDAYSAMQKAAMVPR